MPNPPVLDEGHADDIFGTVVYEALLPPKKDFLPWHQPRKQFVRSRQWREQINKLLDDVKLEDNTLRYLGLPGLDLLDLRYFHNQVCEPRDLRLKFLGFNSGANPASNDQAELNISLDEVRKLALIDPESDIVWDDFCRVSNTSSIAWRKTYDLGPYDVINLDLCDGFCFHAPGILEDTHYRAMSRLLTLQARRKNPWLLLLTTRAGNNHIHGDVLQKLLNKYSVNLRECDSFRNSSAKNFAISDEASLRAAVGAGDGLLTVFLVGLSKWFVGLAINHNPPTKVEIRSVVGYSVENDVAHNDLISMALRFEPTCIPVEDPLGLAGLTVQMPSECNLATKAIGRIAKRKNVDAILSQDIGLYDQMVTDTASLLELARYDINAYHEWLRLPA